MVMDKESDKRKERNLGVVLLLLKESDELSSSEHVAHGKKTHPRDHKAKVGQSEHTHPMRHQVLTACTTHPPGNPSKERHQGSF